MKSLENIDIPGYLARQVREANQSKGCRLIVYIPSHTSMILLSRILKRFGFIMSYEQGDLIARGEDEVD